MFNRQAGNVRLDQINDLLRCRGSACIVGNPHNHHYTNLALIHGHCHDFVQALAVLLTAAA
jgi:hypothetical protein